MTSIEVIKVKIEEYIDAHCKPGDDVYPSTIAEYYDFDYSSVYKGFEELRDSGRLFSNAPKPSTQEQITILAHRINNILGILDSHSMRDVPIGGRGPKKLTQLVLDEDGIILG